MWLFLPEGFVSIAYSREDQSVVMFRFRTRAQAERVRDAYLRRTDVIHETPEADYRYRILGDSIRLDRFLKRVRHQFITNGVENVKNEAARVSGDADYCGAMSDVWSTMYRLQARQTPETAADCSCLTCNFFAQASELTDENWCYRYDEPTAPDDACPLWEQRTAHAPEHRDQSNLFGENE